MHYHDLPNLRIIPVANLLLHELHDNKRVLRLQREISGDKIMINPPIVALIKGTKNYVVLDGANRTTCIKNLGYQHIVVQIVDYFDKRQVRLGKWDHLICGLNKKDKLLMMSIIQNSDFVTVDDKYNILIKQIQKNKLPEQLAFIKSLFKQYKDKTFYRVIGNHIDNFRGEYKNINFLVIYPKLKPTEIIDIAKNNLKVPSGITKHIIPNRAIGIALDLSILGLKKSLSWKNNYLKKLIDARLSAHKIRYYKEPIIIFND